jgi:hypothetical protein
MDGLLAEVRFESLQRLVAVEVLVLEEVSLPRNTSNQSGDPGGITVGVAGGMNTGGTADPWIAGRTGRNLGSQETYFGSMVPQPISRATVRCRQAGTVRPVHGEAVD